MSTQRPGSGFATDASATPHDRCLAFSDVLVKVIPESRKAPLVLFHLLPLAVRLVTAAALGDQATAAKLRTSSGLWQLLNAASVMGPCWRTASGAPVATIRFGRWNSWLRIDSARLCWPVNAAMRRTLATAGGGTSAFVIYRQSPLRTNAARSKDGSSPPNSRAADNLPFFSPSRSLFANCKLHPQCGGFKRSDHQQRFQKRTEEKWW